MNRGFTVEDWWDCWRTTFGERGCSCITGADWHHGGGVFIQHECAVVSSGVGQRGLGEEGADG